MTGDGSFKNAHIVVQSMRTVTPALWSLVSGRNHAPIGKLVCYERKLVDGRDPPAVLYLLAFEWV